MYLNRRVIVLIMAAGNGSRFGADAPKQFLEVGGEAMILRAAKAFDGHGSVDEIWAVTSSGRRWDADAALRGLGKYRGSVAGGDVRQESVRLGLRAVAGAHPGEDAAIALIHDAARPFVTHDVIERVIAGAGAAGAAVACVPVTDTIYEADGEHADGGLPLVKDAPDRGALRAVQTPQGFDLRMILDAHEAAAADGFAATDDGSVARAYGRPSGAAREGSGGTGRGAEVLIVMGDYANRKITVPEDMEFAAPGDVEASGVPGASSHDGDRVGIGFDVHAFSGEGERPLVIGGVTIPYGRGLDGHSDADVLTHSLMDAMLGALALGDIGVFFPDTEERYRGISSMKLLAEVMDMIGRRGYAVYNADVTIIAERPRMAGYADEIRSVLAAALGVPRDRIGVKATTTEGLGFTGREEGIGAQAIVRLTRGLPGDSVAETAEGE
jgi:2-C-methyl-D-erythritol 2,4-cyclodiphosphate synthase/2-C-methyl-D-erythritol 4-phosphate cytidylyltransferase